MRVKWKSTKQEHRERRHIISRGPAGAAGGPPLGGRTRPGYSGVLPSLLSEQFPLETRAIGVSLSFSAAVSIFGGFAPFVATWLIAQTGCPLPPSYYLIFAALLSLGALIAIRRRSRRRDRILALAESREFAAP